MHTLDGTETILDNFPVTRIDSPIRWIIDRRIDRVVGCNAGWPRHHRNHHSRAVTSDPSASVTGECERNSLGTVELSCISRYQHHVAGIRRPVGSLRLALKPKLGPRRIPEASIKVGAIGIADPTVGRHPHRILDARRDRRRVWVIGAVVIGAGNGFRRPK